MPIELEDLNDPGFLSLPIEEQRKGRQQLFDQLQGDPLFKQLPLTEQQRLLKVDTAKAFAQRQLAAGVKPEEIAAEVGGLHAAPAPRGSTAFNIVRGILDPLGFADPIMAIPEFAALGTAPGIVRGAMAMGAFGGARGAEEAMQAGGGLADIARGAAKGAAIRGLTGAVLGPAMAPRATYTAGILAPIGLGGALGFIQAPKGEGLEGAAKGAATFAAMKAGARGISEAAGLVGRGAQATRNLFTRTARAEPGAAPVDAPAGLTDEVLGKSRISEALDEIRELATTQRRQVATELGQFERFYEGKLPPEELLQRNIARSTAEAEAFLAGKRPGPPEPLGPFMGPPGPAERSARAFEEQAARQEQVRQSLRGAELLRGQLAQQQPVEPGAITFRPPPALGGLPAEVTARTTPAGGPAFPIAPPRAFFPGPPSEAAIRLGAPGERPVAGQLPEAGTGQLMDNLVARFGRVGTIKDMSPVERSTLQNLAQAPEMPANIRAFSAQALVRAPEGAQLPPVMEMGGPVFGEGLGRGIVVPKGKGAVTDVNREFGNYIRTYLKGINPGQLEEEFKTAAGKQRFRFLSKGKESTAYDEAAEQLAEAGYIRNPTVDDLQDAMRRAASGEKIYSRFRQTAVSPKARGRMEQQEADAMAAAGIEQETNRANLLNRLQEVKDPNGPEAIAIMKRLEQIGVDIKVPDIVHIDQVGDDTLKGVLQGGMFGPGPRFSKEQVQAAEKIAAKVRPNPDPLDDLQKVNGSGVIEEIAGMEMKPGPRGGAPVTSPGGPGNAPTNSFNLDLNNYWDRIKSFFGIEVKNKLEAGARRIMTMQELARQHPEIAPVYQAYHDYPRRAVNRHVQNMTPLVERTEAGAPVKSYLDLPTQQRQAVDKVLKWQKDNRQGQAPLSDSELQLSRGFTPDMIRASHDALDVGKRILQAHRDDYVNSRLNALVESGVSPASARAGLEIEAARMFRGMDHWVPDSRFGTKVAAAYDQGGNLLEFRLTPNVKQRVEAIKELKAAYPDAKIDEGVLEQFVREKAFDEIDLSSLGILSQRARVDPQVREEFMSQLKPYLLKRSDALARFKQYQGIKGAEEDLRRPLISASSSTFNYLERKQAYREATAALGQINPREKPELFRFAERYIDDNMKPGDKGIRAVRDLAYTYALGGQLRQWPVQLTQYPTVVMPELLKFGTPAQVMNVSKTALRWSFADLNKAPPELKEAMRQAYKEGVFQPRSEMMVGPMFKKLENLPFKEAQIEERLAKELQQFETPAVHRLKQTRDFLMLPITDADMRTRIGAFVSVYDLARKYRAMEPAQATRFAIDEANRTNFLYGTAESPQLFGRGNIALFANMLKNWPAAYTSYLRGVYAEANKEAIAAGGKGLASRLGKMGEAAITGPSPARAFASSVGAMAALGGALYNLPSPLRAAWAAGLGVDPETEMRKLLSGKLGLPDMATEAVLRGLPAIAGVDVSRSLAMGDVLPMTGSISDVVPALGMATTVGQGVGELSKTVTQPFGPDVMDVLERMSGGGLKSAFKAARLAQEGIATRRGGALPGGGEVGLLEVAMQGAGFTPLQVAKAQALQRATQAEVTRHKEIQSNMIEQLATAVHRGDNDQVQRIIKRVQSNNMDAMAKNRPDLLITVSEQQIRQRVAEMITSKAAIKRTPEVMRRRVLELQDIYGAGPPVPPE